MSSSIRYHINPETGEPNICTATVRGCKYSVNGQVPEHYKSKEEARKAFERQMMEETKIDLIPKHIFDNGLSVKIPNERVVEKLLRNVKPYSQWNEGFVQLKNKNEEFKLNLKISDKLMNSTKFQIRNFLAEHKEYAFSREHLLMIEDKLVKGRKSADIIQVINKVEQDGLKKYSFKRGKDTYYSFPEIKFTAKYLAKRKNYTTKEEILADEMRQREYFSDLSKDDYEIGHKDPRLELTVENMVMQPSEINRSYKDNYIFDHNGLPKVPNPEAFVKNPEKFYNGEDLRMIYDALKAVFNEE